MTWINILILREGGKQMRFNNHDNMEGFHAPFGASKSSWLRYDDERAIEYFKNIRAAEVGTRLHEWAKETIDLGLKQPRSKKTIYAYVVFVYSERFFRYCRCYIF